MIDPVALQIGPLAIRWYALAYLAGTEMLGWRYVIAQLTEGSLDKEDIDDLIQLADYRHHLRRTAWHRAV